MMTGSPDRDHIVAQVCAVGDTWTAQDLFAKGEPFDLSPIDGLEDGDVVLVALGPGGARALERLARAGSALAGLYELLAERQVDPFFPASVRLEVEALLASPGLDDPALIDLEHLPFVTSDNASSRDLDQALFIQRGAASLRAPGEEAGEAADRGQGDATVQSGGGPGYTVFYALADAAYYVRPGTALWREAQRRGASFYLPGVVAPMLPKALSEGIVSLNAEVPRRALVFLIRLDEQGARAQTEIAQARVRSRAKLTYDGVQALHDDPCGSPLTERPWTESLMLLGEVGKKRLALSEARDVVQFNRVSSEIGFTDDEGSAFEARLDVRNDIERWNEQISLLCNMEGARFMSADADPHVQPIYRVHPFPEGRDLERLSAQIDALVAARGLDPAVWRWPLDGDGPRESLARFVERLPADEASARVRQAIERQAMITIAPSSFTDVRGPHFGIGAEQYARFSAPMREIVGIFTHKEALEKLHGPSPEADNAADEALREQVIEAGNRSKGLQRELTKAVHHRLMDQLFADDLQLPVERRPARVGTVLGVRSSRLYVQLDDPPMEIKVYAEDLAALDGAPPTTNDSRTILTRATGAAIKIGDAVHLRVDGRDPTTGRWLILPQ